MHFGFSYIGVLYLLMLFIPNLLWTKYKPEHYEEIQVKENKYLLVFERIGEVLVCSTVVMFSDFNPTVLNIHIVYFILSAICMLLYLGYWYQYFTSEHKLKDFYTSYLSIPLAGATLPVIAFLLLGIYGNNIYLILSTLILAVGHIGIHSQHLKEIQ